MIPTEELILLRRLSPDLQLFPLPLPTITKPGKKFLVIYDTENPKESIIRLDYPIKDSTDFRRYVKEFEQMRKQKEE